MRSASAPWLVVRSRSASSSLRSVDSSSVLAASWLCARAAATSVRAALGDDALELEDLRRAGPLQLARALEVALRDLELAAQLVALAAGAR